jgi:glycosyltransferase involved in cell wall biosynthesis
MNGFECFELSDVVHGKDLYKGRLPWRLIHERYLFRSFVNNVDADIVVATVGAPELFIGAISLSRNPLYILHTYPSEASTRFRQLFKHITYSSIFPKNIKIITVSEYSRRRIIDAWGLGRRADDISVVYSTVGDSKGSRNIRHERPLTVLTVGHVEDYKNPDTWLRMAIDLKQKNPDLNVKFVWVGDGAQLEAYRRRVVELGVNNYITFVGHDNDVAKYYKQCDVYVQPSRIESLGLSVLDAMRRGIPCVVSNTGGLTEVIINGENGWTVDADDPIGLSNRVELLLRDAQCRGIFGKRSLERYEAYFSHKRWAEVMWSHHISLLAA